MFQGLGGRPSMSCLCTVPSSAEETSEACSSSLWSEYHISRDRDRMGKGRRRQIHWEPIYNWTRIELWMPPQSTHYATRRWICVLVTWLTIFLHVSVCSPEAHIHSAWVGLREPLMACTPVKSTHISGTSIVYECLWQHSSSPTTSSSQLCCEGQASWQLERHALWRSSHSPLWPQLFFNHQPP